MENELKLIGETLLEKKFKLAKEIHETRLSEISIEQRQTIPSSIEEKITEIRANFIGLFGEFLIQNVQEEVATEQIENWAKEASDYVFKLGVSLDEALKDTILYRTYIRKVIEEVVLEHDMSVRTLFATCRIVDPMLDHAVYCFSLTFVQYYTANLENAKKLFIELSVPVVPLSKEIAVLPLVGNIDTERASLLMENTMREVGKLKVTNLILDLSGVAIVDTMVAQQIFNLSSALKLLGVQTIITGVRPEIAQTAVSLGLDFSDQITRGSLQQALTNVKLAL
ncbi:STAS domain-containing protein [Chungangia koreensis]|uniref:STAS domain-containing protein n=1 Tax=Chungangia koreensis TaxID=752657 RepID=A0ABV8X8T5_9LACT